MIRLKHKHEYQHHKAEEAHVQKKPRTKIHERIEVRLLQLINQHENGELTATRLAIECGRTVKMKNKINVTCVVLFCEVYSFFSYRIIFDRK